MKKLIYCLLFFLWAGCVDELEIDLPAPEPKLVVNALLNPDSLIKVHLSKTASVFDSIPEYVEDADVIIYENGLNLTPLYYQSDGFYSTELIKPEAGKIYRIEIATNEFGLTSACDTLPYFITGLSCSTSDLLGSYNNGDQFAELTVNFKDDPNKDNYYELFLFTEYSENYSWGIDTMTFLASWFSNEPALIEENLNAQEPALSSCLFTDQFFDSEHVSVHLNYFPGAYSNDGEPYFPDYYRLIIVFHSVSKQYFDFKSKFNLYLDSRNDFWEPGEAVYLKGNIENGLGIFAGYSTVIDSLTWDYSNER
jgi:hypothetical protein